MGDRFLVCFSYRTKRKIPRGLAVPKELSVGPDRRRQAFAYGRWRDVGSVRCVRSFPVGDGKLSAARYSIFRHDRPGTLRSKPMPNCSLYVP